MNQRTYRSSGSGRNSRSSSPDFIRLLLFYILPFVVINALIFFLVTAKPKYELVIGATDDYRTTEITFSIKSHMPLKNVTITMDSQPVDMVKTGRKTYTSTITHNGVLEIYMENFNGMAIAGFEHIDILDNELPSIEEYVAEDGVLSFTVTDSQSGVDYASIHGITPAGETIQPLSVDKASGKISFPISSDGLSVSVSDLSGNEYLTTFSINNTDTSN